MLENHPAADAFPMMEKSRFEEHKADINTNGQLEPITLCDGKILDGRNRYKACIELGIEPRTKVYSGNPWNYAWSLNGARRDLTDLQRGAIKYQIDRQSDTWQDEQDAKRQAIEEAANAKRRDAAKEQENRANQYTKKVEVVVPKEQAPAKQSEQREEDRAPGRAERAKAANVSPSTQAKVEWIANKRPDLLEKVAKGEVKGSNVIKQIKADERKRVAEEVEKVTPRKAEKVVSVGDWWQLGDHLLFCGDTSQIEFKMGLPSSVALAFADPPYGAGKEGYDDSCFYWEHDYLQGLAEIVVVTPGIVSVFEFARKTEMPYKWSIACWLSNGMTRGAIGFGNWIYGAVFSAGSVFRQKQDFCQVAIKNNETDDTSHSTRKPAGFMLYIIETFTSKGEDVVDPFLGSGQTLLSCEALGRKCIGGEIDPKFCESIIARWESMSGGEAVKQ